MDTFLTLNSGKLKFAFTATSIILLGVVGIILAIGYFTGNVPHAQLLLAILLSAGIAFPLFIILLAYLGWHFNRSLRKKAFSIHPINQIERIGFYKSYLNASNKWFFTEEIKKGKINGFTLLIDFKREKNLIIEVEAPTKWKKLDKIEYRRLNEKFSQLNIEFRIGSLVKRYDTKLATFHTIYHLKEDLENFTEILKNEGFEPLHQ